MYLSPPRCYMDIQMELQRWLLESAESGSEWLASKEVVEASESSAKSDNHPLAISIKQEKTIGLTLVEVLSETMNLATVLKTLSAKVTATLKATANRAVAEIKQASEGLPTDEQTMQARCKGMYILRNSL